MENIKIKANDGLMLDCFYQKVENPKASIIIVHGMVEHKERYEYFINNLVNEGYSVIISDLRGHGKSINDDYKLGQIGSISLMVEDQKCVYDYLKNDNPNTDIYMFGHSMGSLIAREFIKKYSNELKKLILSGTVGYQAGCYLAVLASKFKLGKKSKNKSSKLLFFFSNNASFKYDLSWLSYSKENIERYANDPLCTFKFSNFSYNVLFTMAHNLHKHNKNQIVNKDLKILSVSGKDDRTTLGTKGVLDTIKHLKKEGFNDISYIEYPNMKHEILQEDNKDDVIKDVLKFYNE